MFKLYRQNDLNCKWKKNYNFRLLWVGRIIENVFEILTVHFRIFHAAIILLKLKHIESVVKQVVFYNYSISIFVS